MFDSNVHAQLHRYNLLHMYEMESSKQTPAKSLCIPGCPELFVSKYNEVLVQSLGVFPLQER